MIVVWFQSQDKIIHSADFRKNLKSMSLWEESIWAEVCWRRVTKKDGREADRRDTVQITHLLCIEWIKTAQSVTSTGCGYDPVMPVSTLPPQNPYWNNESVQLSTSTSWIDYNSHMLSDLRLQSWAASMFFCYFGLFQQSRLICPPHWKDTCRSGRANVPMTGKLSVTRGAKNLRHQLPSALGAALCMLCMCQILSWEKIRVLLVAVTAHSLFI